MKPNARALTQPIPDHNLETAFKLKVLTAISEGLREESPGVLLVDLAKREVQLKP